MIIAIDFDGTCVTHDFPMIGKDIGAAPVLLELANAGHNLILFTMRSDDKKPSLSDAVKWFQDNGIPLYGIQENPTQKSWTSSPKAYAQMYIDDAALGCPLLEDGSISDRPFADWVSIRALLVEKGIIPVQ